MVTSRPVSCCRCRVTEPLLSTIMRQAGDRSAVGVPPWSASSLLPCTRRPWLSASPSATRGAVQGHPRTSGGTSTAVRAAGEPDEIFATQLP